MQYDWQGKRNDSQIIEILKFAEKLRYIIINIRDILCKTGVCQL